MPPARRPACPKPVESRDPLKVELGRVVGSHGLRGAVRVRFFGDDPQHLMNAEEVWLGEGREDRHAKSFGVLSGGMGRAREVRLELAGVADRDAADALRGRYVLALARDLEPLQADEFYWHELVGCSVYTEAGIRVGEVCEIWETGAHDVLVVRDAEGRQNLIPTARELTREIDREARRIVVASLPGLIDLGDDPEAHGEGG